MDDEFDCRVGMQIMHPLFLVSLNFAIQKKQYA
jgi:hypothetical protein